MKLKYSSRVLASMLAVGLAGTLALNSPASSKTITGNTDGISFETISQSCSVGATLEIQKQKHKPYQNAAPENIPAGVISGLTFEALHIRDVDITTNEGWHLATSLTLKEAENRGYVERFTAVTNVEGIAQFEENLPVGLYLIREVTPSNPHEDHRTSEPFLTTLPVGNAAGDAWQCDVVIKTKESPDPDPTPTPPTPTPPTPTPPTPIPPVVPPVTTTHQPEEEDSKTPDKESPRSNVLASTGANILWLLGGAILVIIAGVIFVARGRKSQK